MHPTSVHIRSVQHDTIRGDIYLDIFLHPAQYKEEVRKAHQYVRQEYPGRKVELTNRPA